MTARLILCMLLWATSAHAGVAAKPFLSDPNRSLMRLAEKITDRAVDELRTRGRP